MVLSSSEEIVYLQIYIKFVSSVFKNLLFQDLDGSHFHSYVADTLYFEIFP